MPPNEKTKRVVWVQGGGRCAICREPLIEKGIVPDFTHLLGEVAHIVAEEIKGPRGVSPLSVAERNASANLLLLCLKHHKIVDDDPRSYPVSMLQKLKLQHEVWVKDSLSRVSTWKTKLAELYYLNVPRLSLLSAREGIRIDVSRYGAHDSLSELGFELNGLILDFQKVLKQVELKAVPLNSSLLTNDSRGMLVSFDQRFRTKNVGGPISTRPAAGFSGDLKKDPHIYCEIGDWKVVINIDSRWITTSTALCNFRPSSGRGKFAGLGFIGGLDAKTKVVRVTPYVIGMPSNPLMEEFWGIDS